MKRPRDFCQKFLYYLSMSYKLINNAYHPEQAKELINSLVETKINQLKHFKNEERTTLRLDELKKTLREIHQLLDLAETNKWLVKIDAEIKSQLLKLDNT